MDLGRAFSFITEDERWLNKLLLGGLICIIPIIGQIAVIGYMLEIARNVTQGNPRPLPEWSNFGDKLIKGLYGFVIQIIYGIPLLILVFIAICVMISSGLATNSNEEALGSLMLLMVFCFMPIILLLSLLIQPLVIAAMGRYVQTDSLSAALQIGTVISTLRSSLYAWLMLLLVYILCGIIGGLGSIFFGIGVYFTITYSYMVFGHALGQTIVQTSGLNNPGFISSKYESPL